MCATLLAPEVTMTTPFVDAAWHQYCNFKRVEHTEGRKRPLSMKWVVVTDEHGNRKLRMRWTGTRSFLPGPLRKATPRGIEPELGRVSGPIPIPKRD